MKTKKQIFYGWYVVVAGCLVVAMTLGTVYNCFSQFIKPVCEDMGFTRQQMGVNQTIMSISALLFGIFWGWISRHIKLHRVMCVSALLMPAAYFCYSFASSLPMFYIITVFVTVFNCFISTMIITYIIGNWFIKSSGLAIGLTSMGTGLGGMVMNTLISHIIVNLGWRSAYQVVAAVVFVLVVPSVWFVIREFPADKGMQPYGYEEKPETKGSATIYSGYTLEEVKKMPLFWIMMVISVVMVMALCCYYQTISPHLSDSGYSVTFAAGVTSVSMGGLALGKVILGKLYDKFGTRTTTLFSCVCTFIGALGMIFCQNTICLVLIVLGVCLGCSFGTTCMPIITRKLFGTKDFGAIYGLYYAAVGLGSAFAPVISGRTYDLYGSYTPIYGICAGCIAVCILVMWKALPKKEQH